ncbi:transposase [Segeticoccus rhizosphaerae]|uniref:transposase n=1 Tax=Segeticoccus rhizosphaerae TaxID=1104777 RepID=UPI0010BFFA3A|nr:transposase [Ornithinicoccus soli]
MIINDATTSALPRGGSAHLDRFRAGAYACLTRRGDALFELAEAIACGVGRVTDLAHLSLDACHRRGHGGLYDGVNSGRLDAGRLRRLIVSGPLPTITGPDGRARIVLAVDVSNWLRPDAATSPDRSFCHTYARGRGQAQMIPGWPYSFIVALESGASSWTSPLDVVRIRPGDDATVVTANQLRSVIGELTCAGHWKQGDPDVLVVMDAGYDVVRLSWLLSDLPVTLIGRVRSDRVFYGPAGKRRGPTKGRPPRHGAKMVLRRAATYPEPAVTTSNGTGRYGHARAQAIPRVHPKLESRGGWASHHGPELVESSTGLLQRQHVARLRLLSHEFIL